MHALPQARCVVQESDAPDVRLCDWAVVECWRRALLRIANAAVAKAICL